MNIVFYVYIWKEHYAAEQQAALTLYVLSLSLTIESV